MPEFRVDAGWTLFETIEGTHVNLPGVGITPFRGVPIREFDFQTGHLTDLNRRLGVINTSRADSIAKRLLPAVAGGPGETVAIPVELVALHLRSTNTVGGPFGGEHVSVTLQSARGGPQSLGVMQVNFETEKTGTFSTTFQIHFDLRVGDGQFQPQQLKAFHGLPTRWSKSPPAEAHLLQLVNWKLDGLTEEGFFPVEVMMESAAQDVHRAKATR